jgi:curved DNA-binding protein CbpA
MYDPDHDYYALLGVRADAGAAAIKRAYRSAVRAVHPDVNPDDPRAEELARRVNQAGETLLDPDARAAYDAARAAHRSRRRPARRPRARAHGDVMLVVVEQMLAPRAVWGALSAFFAWAADEPRPRQRARRRAPRRT